MKQIFFDKEKLVVIKVFPNSKTLRREILGAKIFSQFVLTPDFSILDRKVVKISLMSGFLGYQVDQKILYELVANFLLNVTSCPYAEDRSIFAEIKRLKNFFTDEEYLKTLSNIEKSLTKQKLYPIHGDLQKQNILIINGRLGLIDFEHFIFAPKELEICNSLFFDDGNCLDIPTIIRLLPARFINKKTLKLMLSFFMLKQISQGLDLKLAQKRLKASLLKAEDLREGSGDVVKTRYITSFCLI